MAKSDRFATGDLPDIGGMKFERSYEPASPEREDDLPGESTEQYVPPYEPPESDNRPPKKQKSRRGCGCLVGILVFLVIIGGFLFGAALLIGSRDTGSVTVLLAGTDEEGTRTDTVILAGIKNRQLTLMSIPRDTYCSGYGYSVPKINSAYGYAGCGEAGMEELCDRVYDVTGIRPDGYVLVDLDCFETIVDRMGGVDFDVPMDMHYEDPYQDLYIDLKAGMQHLNGGNALSVVRFRSGSAMADLTRVEVQRDFLKACAKQWLSPMKLLRAPGAVPVILRNVDTDMNRLKLANVFSKLLFCSFDNMNTETLPGTPQMINGGSYYVCDSEKTRELVARLFR